jgi:hypothetical protein
MKRQVPVQLENKKKIDMPPPDLLYLLHFNGFWGMCGENSCNVLLLLFMVFWVYLRDALQEGSDDVVACLLVPHF